MLIDEKTQQIILDFQKKRLKLCQWVKICFRFHVKTIFTCESCGIIFEQRWKYDKHMEQVFCFIFKSFKMFVVIYFIMNFLNKGQKR